jgi:hypothetical protein
MIYGGCNPIKGFCVFLCVFVCMGHGDDALIWGIGVMHEAWDVGKPKVMDSVYF